MFQANIKEITIDIPHAFHNSIIGAKGRLIRSVMEECGGVIIRFPPTGSTSDRVTIRGPKDDVESARKQLLELSQERKDSSHSAEVQAKPEYHKFLIGRGGANIRKVRERTGARVVFPVAGDADQDVIMIMGRKDEVAKAKVEIESLVANLVSTHNSILCSQRIPLFVSLCLCFDKMQHKSARTSNNVSIMCINRSHLNFRVLIWPHRTRSLKMK